MPRTPCPATASGCPAATAGRREPRAHQPERGALSPHSLWFGVVSCAELVHGPSENGVVVNGWRRAVFRLGAAAGIAGPTAFTGAWIASSLRQTRQGPGGLQLSGLAAPDARDPWIMLAGFLVAGGCTVAFGAAPVAAIG